MAQLLTKSAAALAVLIAAVAVIAACSETLPGIPNGTGPGTVGQLGEADGVVLDRVAVDADVPAVTKLDPRLRKAVRRAAQAAERDGVTMHLTSGWRSARYQQYLYDDAVRRDGAEEAARLVASPAESEHVTGDAVDVGPTEAAYWMDRYSERFGLCRTYANEVWHYELRTGASCPELVTDASARQR
ncbi:MULTISPECIES: M15 family metallopeptidase [Tsukamurella]|uniref:M15 family metallopeptidase n=2 Tax=Tsukamurella TaxID=2060 RepID=A0A5C5RX80_9ACTN|nr:MULTISPECIES: M15 family metallopeptidase [Tsukamurella]NMD57100.1 M15 family metallopeptidase [Tsukamurella columbiensis]TWS27676.1 M15 family metallopeptidase [Tsukamurella conjunctivitidis]